MGRAGRYTLAVMAWVAAYAGWSSVIGLVVAAITGDRPRAVSPGVSALLTVIGPLVPTLVALWFNDWARDGFPSREQQRAARAAAPVEGAATAATPAATEPAAAVPGATDAGPLAPQVPGTPPVPAPAVPESPATQPVPAAPVSAPAAPVAAPVAPAAAPPAFPAVPTAPRTVPAHPLGVPAAASPAAAPAGAFPVAPLLRDRD